MVHHFKNTVMKIICTYEKNVVVVYHEVKLQTLYKKSVNIERWMDDEVLCKKSLLTISRFVLDEKVQNLS